ncbi:MAG: hypothetical protein JWL84_3010 [Rhodospirillales bacterium]|nr:hypothetical protein [Rhodospirillales bacterium]
MSNAAEPQIDAAAIEDDARSNLAQFQQTYPLRSTRVGDQTWIFRRTPGRSSDQLPVLMLPGIQGGGDIFFDAGLALGEVMPVITVSAPDIEDVAGMTAGIGRFLRTIGVARAHLVGSSLGGYLAQSFALRSPDMAEQMVIANGFFEVEAFIAKLPPMATVAEMDASTLVEQNLGPLLATPASDKGQVRMKAIVKGLVGPIQTLENYKSRVLLMMGAHSLAAPTIPSRRVMIIDDDHDPMLPRAMRDAVRDRFKRSEHHAIDGGGHLPAIQRPAQFADLLRRRLARDA